MLVDVSHMLGKTEVVVSITLVTDQPEDIETREKGGRELDVSLGGLLDVVASKGWVGSGEDGDTSVEGGHDASLEERERGGGWVNI